jgi:hypothetical protein
MVPLHTDLEWLFGDLFVRRIEFEHRNRDVYWSQMIRKIQSKPDAWAKYIRDYKAALANPDVAPQKIADELKLNAKDFDGALFDSFAEISAVPKLQRLGFDSFEVQMRRASEKTPDLKALRNREGAALEVKNLRAHECVEVLLPKLFEDRKLKGQDMSGIRLVVKRSFRDTLVADEQEALSKIIERIKDYPRNQDIAESLSERAVVNFKVIDGLGDVMCSDDITVEDLTGDIRDFRGLFSKMNADLAKAAQQLYSPAASNAQLRVVVMRWDIPWFRLIAPGELQRVASTIFQRELKKLARPVDLFVFSDYQFELFSTLKSGGARQQRQRSDDIEERIRKRAYEIYEKRINGSALSDWLQAESEIRHGKTSGA